MASLIIKRTYTWGLSWVTTRWVDLCIWLKEPSKFMLRPYLGSVTHTVEMISKTPYSFEAVSLGAASNLGKANGIYIPRIGEGVRYLYLPESSSRINQCHLLHDLSQKFSPELMKALQVRELV